MLEQMEDAYRPHPKSMGEYLMWWLCAILDAWESRVTCFYLSYVWKTPPRGPQRARLGSWVSRHWPESCIFKASLSHGGGWLLPPWRNMHKYYESVKDILGA